MKIKVFKKELKKLEKMNGIKVNKKSKKNKKKTKNKTSKITPNKMIKLKKRIIFKQLKKDFKIQWE